MTEQRHHLAKRRDDATAFATWQEASASFATLDIDGKDADFFGAQPVEYCAVRYSQVHNGWFASIILTRGRFVRYVARSC